MLFRSATDIPHTWRYVFHPFLEQQSSAHQIIWQIRAPRVAAAILVGAALGISGSMAQSSTNNPLADPAILGTSAGASLGVLIGVVTNLVPVGSIGAVLCAAIGALAATFLTSTLARSALQLITIGIGVSAILNAIVGLTISAINKPEARSISFWSFGSLALVTPKNLFILELLSLKRLFATHASRMMLIVGQPLWRWNVRNCAALIYACEIGRAHV